MSWLIWRELAVVTRTAAWWASAALQTLLLSAFITIWGDGVPVWPTPFFAQFAAVHLAFLGVTMPWVAMRVLQDDVTRLALLALVTVEKPARLILARAIALTVALTVYVVTALPATSIAMRISALTPASIAESMLWPLALCGFVAALVTMVSTLTASDRVAAWLLVSAITLAMLAAAPRSGAGLIVLFAATTTMIGTAAMSANRSLRYVNDPLPPTPDRQLE
jgi:hypothetical protein